MNAKAADVPPGVPTVLEFHKRRADEHILKAILRHTDKPVRVETRDKSENRGKAGKPSAAKTGARR